MVCLCDILRQGTAIAGIAARYGATNLRVFGSVARGEQHQASDVDLLVTLSPDASLLEHAGLMQDISELLACEVDTVSDRAIHPRLKDRILRRRLPVKDDLIYLEHMRDAIDRIFDCTSVGRHAFKTTPMTIRQITIIGEATRALPNYLKDRRPEIPWKQVAGMRDVLVHDYVGVDVQEVWRVVEVHLVGLREAVDHIYRNP